MTRHPLPRFLQWAMLLQALQRQVQVPVRLTSGLRMMTGLLCRPVRVG